MSMRLDDRDSNLNRILNSISNRFDEYKIFNAGKPHHFDAKQVRDVLLCRKWRCPVAIRKYI